MLFNEDNYEIDSMCIEWLHMDECQNCKQHVSFGYIDTAGTL